MSPAGRSHTTKAVAAGAVAVAALLSLAACSGSTARSKGSGTTAAKASTGLIIELSGPLSTPGFSQRKLGSSAVAKAMGLDYQYSAPASLSNFAPDYTALINQAIARHPAAMVIGNFIPSAFDPLIKKATAAGIPVVVQDSGISTWKADGAIAYVGQSPETIGEDAASSALKAGAQHLLCVDQTTNPLVEQICVDAKSAMQKAGGSYDQLNVPLNDIGNPAALTQDIQGYLSSHSDVDGVFTAGSGFGTDAATAVANLGKTGRIKVGGNEVIGATLQDVKAGKIQYEIGIQPYLMGYYSVQIAGEYLESGQYPQGPVITSGLVIDKNNVDTYLSIDRRAPGVLG
jgi:simple sugar transport system substrate-binding protein